MSISSNPSAANDDVGCGDCGLVPCLCDEMRLHARRVSHSFGGEVTAHAQSGNYTEALASLRGAQAHGSNDPWISESMGWCSLALGDIPSAREAWETAALRNPQGPAAKWVASLDGGEIAFKNGERVLDNVFSGPDTPHTPCRFIEFNR